MASTRLGREPHMLEGLYPSLPGSLSPGWDPPHPRSGNSHSRPQAELGRGSQALPRVRTGAWTTPGQSSSGAAEIRVLPRPRPRPLQPADGPGSCYGRDNPA